jgi:PIN domain nuclease of toxin-antitoxin system
VKVAVDTHALLWYLQGSSKLSLPARDALDDGIRVGGVVVSIGILFDLVYLTEKGKLPMQAMQQVRHVIADVGLPFSLVPVNILVMDHFTEPGPTRLPDPWDRLIVATAASQGLPLVTRDEEITASGLVQTIW